MTKSKRKPPSTPPSAKQLAARAAFAERNRSRGKVVVEVGLAVGDNVRVKIENPRPGSPPYETGRGVIDRIDGATITVRRGGFSVRYPDTRVEKV